MLIEREEDENRWERNGKGKDRFAIPPSGMDSAQLRLLPPLLILRK